MGKSFSDRFSMQIEKYKNKYKFTSYTDAIISFLGENIIKNRYDFICFSNIGNYVNKSLRDKLLIEFSNRSMIKKNHQKKSSNELF